MKAEAIEVVFRHSAGSQVAHGCLYVRPRVENSHREAQSWLLTHEFIHPLYGLNTRTWGASSTIRAPRLIQLKEGPHGSTDPRCAQELTLAKLLSRAEVAFDGDQSPEIAWAAR